MKILDALDNELLEGVPVTFPLAFGQAIAGNVVKISTGLGVGPEAIPQVLVGFVLPLQVSPSGRVGGVYVLPEPAKLSA
jgi:hypothetical protein